jgi:hypothetical protein
MVSHNDSARSGDAKYQAHGFLSFRLIWRENKANLKHRDAEKFKDFLCVSVVSGFFIIQDGANAMTVRAALFSSVKRDI